MPLVDNAWYVNFGNGTSTGYYAVAPWTALTAYAAGQLVRQLAAPAVGSERVFVCIVAGTTLASEPSWTLTRGAKTAEAAGPTWQECTGIAALNGDATNTPSWTITATPPGGVKNIAVVLGQVIKRDNGASYQICTTAGTAGNGSEPAFSDTAGTTTADNTVTWTSLGVVGNFTGWQAPHARLANSFTSTWGQAGNAFFAASEHVETQAAGLILTSPGTVSSPCFVYSVTKTALPPASTNLSAGASIATTGANNISIRSVVYFYGVTFTTGQNINIQQGSGATYWQRFDSCLLKVNNATGGAGIFIGLLSGAVGQSLEMNNTVLQFGSTGHVVTISGVRWVWRNTGSAIAGTIPDIFITPSNAIGSFLDWQGVDLSAAGSGKTIIGSLVAALQVRLSDCKLGASVTVASTPVVP